MKERLFSKSNVGSEKGSAIKKWVVARNDTYVPHTREIFVIQKKIPLGKVEGLNDPYLETKFNKFREQTRQRFNKSQLKNKPSFKLN